MKRILLPDFVHQRDDVLLQRRSAELALDLQDPAVKQLVKHAVHDEPLILRSGSDDVVEELIEVDAPFVDHVHSAEIRKRLGGEMQHNAVDEIVDVIADLLKNEREDFLKRRV